ncbi:putative RND superfamily exporter protein [Aquimarina sp. EL_43]|uniref:efflux RND transporter permease subunit n=1 Tax=Aquimarina TaxID=290174 RepID=UPI00046F4A79|nr:MULTISPECIES: efflux RND transporter permease subunit [Aquimarina]MBG6133014.1 putative RND superfamily exporter protein [Aquimarina sp. EL_35]MBG6152325.1 putative RND superfamily exporter protein [Aquimarina sp. EL_32]MBG6171163.1 putative RND superfamily exporter protein [Aquimarina sp. EL_43]
MAKLFSFGFWNALAGIILRNRAVIFLAIIGITVFLGFQWKNMKFSHSEANLLPDDHEVNILYQKFLQKFGEEGNLIVMAVKDSTLFTPKKLKAWNDFNNSFKKYEEIDLVVSIADLKTLKKEDNPARFELVPFIKDSSYTEKQVSKYENELFNKLPFYEGLVYSTKSKTIQSALYLKKDIVNTKKRKKFIEEVLLPSVLAFENEYKMDVKVSGMPYIRTLNSQNIMDEIEIFILAALLVTSLIFFFFFRSLRATFISMTAVIIGVMWAFGILGLLEYEITVLTAIIPPLVIVIGIPNCIFLINKYQQEIKKHGNKAKSLQRVITKVGNATLMTNVTTASGFATFALTESKLLKEFGIVASLNIIALFILCLLVITIIYSYMPQPKERHLKHLGKGWIEKLMDWMEKMVKTRRVTIYFSSVIILIVSIIGIYTIKVSGSLLEDMPKSAGFYKDIEFFEEEFDGVMPLEILVDTKRKQGVLKLPTLKRMEKLQELLEETPELSKPISIVNLVKYSKQAFYNGNPKYYQIPTSQERNFILPYAKSFESKVGVMNSYVDSTGQYARITTFMKDVGTEEMERIEATLKPQLEKIFPKERYDVSFTGKALIFQKGTKYLVWNLSFSLGLAVILIALFMAWMFRSWKMIVISLIPNLLPLLMTAGLMGYLGVPIKPSTILVFSIAFGISVDDTIHFLAKYRQELKSNHWRIRKSVLASLRETGVSMFYTSTVLFFGFSVFMISSFGGTKALGGLVSTTLLFAMLANLLLLPSLLLSLERSIANKKTLKEPTLKIIPNDEELEETQGEEE